MRRFAGLDLNGWHDRVALSWHPHAQEELEVGAERVVDCGVGGGVVQLTNHARLLGGPQTVLAPHGRGPGWGQIGAANRRQEILALLAALEAGESQEAGDALSAVIAGLCPGAEQAVLAVPDLPDFDDATQQRFLDVLQDARARRPFLLWRSVALALSAIEQGLAGTPGSRIGVLEHSARGLRVQTLEIKGAGGRLLAPERREAGRETAWAGGLTQLRAEGQRRLQAANPEVTAETLQTARSVWNAVLGLTPEPEVVRKSNGDWLLLIAPEERLMLPPPPDDLSVFLADCDLVFLDTPFAGALRDSLVENLAPAVSQSLRTLDSDAVASGALIAADRLARGIPVYFDFLPQIAVLVLKAEGPVFEDQVPSDATVAANEIYRTPVPPTYRWPAGQKEISFYIDKEGAACIRRWKVTLSEAPAEEQNVSLHLEQRPAQGMARIDVRSDGWNLLARSPIRLDWSKLEDDPRDRETIIRELQPPPSYPDRMVLPCSAEAWQESHMSKGFSALLQQLPPSYEGLAIALSMGVLPVVLGGKRVRAINSDGMVPDGIDPAVLDKTLMAACEDLRQDLHTGRPAKNNDRLRFVTWCFARCPLDIQKELLSALRSFSHPWRAPRASETVIWQGIGRTFDDAGLIRQVLDILLVRPRSAFKMHQRACLAFLMSRKDATIDVLSAAEMLLIASHTTAFLREEIGGEFKRIFAYSLQMTASLLRFRHREPYAFLPDRDPSAAALRDTLQALIADMDRRRGFTRQRAQTMEVLRFLEGEGGKADLLVALAEDADLE